MEKSALSDAEFGEFADQVVLFLHNTWLPFPPQYTGERPPDQDMLKEKGGRGFPHLVWMDASGDVITNQGDRSVEGFQKTLGTVRDYLALEKKAQGSSDAKAQAQLFLAKLDLGKMTPDEAKERMGEVTLDAAQKKQAEQQILNLEVTATMSSIRSREAMAEAGAKFAEMKRAGRVPTGDAMVPFWNGIMMHADQNGDAKLFEEALNKLKAELKGPRFQRMFQQAEKRLEELRGQGQQGDKDGEQKQDGAGK